MIRAECKIPNCSWFGRYWMFTSHAEDEAVWHAYTEHLEEWKAVIGDRPPRNDHPPDVQPIEDFLVTQTDFRCVTTTTDLTDEILHAAEYVYDGWYADAPRIDWLEFMDRLDGTPLADGSTLDLGGTMHSPAILAIIEHINEYKKEDQR